MKGYAPLLVIALLAGCDRDRTGTTETTGATTPVDNTRMNQRDRSGTVTPVDQSNSAADLATAQSVRQAIMRDDSLSMDAKNVKIIVNGGVLTLRGPVKSEAERGAIELKAAELAGPNRIDNQLEVEAPK